MQFMDSEIDEVLEKVMQFIDLEIDEALEKEQKLWRYMDLSKFVSMLEKDAIWLARADTFRDKHEGRFPDVMRKIIEQAYEGFDDKDKLIVKDADDFQDYLLKNTFISCWHKNFDENMVMWEIYGRDNKSLAVQTTVENIERSIDVSNMTGHSLILKNVIYQNADEISEVLPYEECFFRKHRHFSFVDEVRICLDTYLPNNPSKKTPYGHALPVLINGFVDKILIHPDSSDWFVDVIESITKKYEVHASVSRGLYGTK